MQKLIIPFIAVALFLAVLFFDQNRSPVPVKIILGNPYPVRLSSVIVISMLAGAAATVAGMFGYKIIRLRKKTRPVADHNANPTLM
jgi:H+/gluconate symporter-like permease